MTIYVVKLVTLENYNWEESIQGIFDTYYTAETFMREAYKKMDEHDKFAYFEYYVIETWKVNHCKWSERMIYYKEYLEDSD